MNEAAIWNEIYEKTGGEPGWADPGTDPNLARIVGGLAAELAASAGTELATGTELKLVDIGCGNGRNAAVADRAAERAGVAVAYTGLDFSAAAVAAGRRLRGADKRFAVADLLAPAGAADWAALGAPFDLAFDCGCFHAIPPDGRAAYAANLRALTRPGSRVVVAGWFRAPGVPWSEEPQYHPYLYLKEWFFNADDLGRLFGPHFVVAGEAVDTAIYDGLNDGFAYVTLERV